MTNVSVFVSMTFLSLQSELHVCIFNLCFGAREKMGEAHLSSKPCDAVIPLADLITKTTKKQLKSKNMKV